MNIQFIIASIAKRSAFVAIRLVFVFFQWIWYEIRGINQRRRLASHPDHYYTSAEIVKIRARHYFCYSDLRTLSDFILTHERFTIPDDVLKKDSISLFFLNENFAVFADSGDKTPLWDGKYGDFYRASSFFKSTKLIILPISSFLRLAETVDFPRTEVVFVCHTLRCGSTLLSHMLSNTGQCRVLCVPESFNCLSNMFYKNIHSEDHKKALLNATIKCECKSLESGLPKAVVIKIAGSNGTIDTEIRKYFPQGKHLFMYRNMPDSVRSHMSLLPLLPTMTLACVMGGIWRRLGDVIGSRMMFPHNPLGVKYSGYTEYTTWVWMTIIKHYLSHCGNRKSFAFRYEDLIRNPREVLIEIFTEIGIDLDNIDKAMSALEVHSQANSPFAMKNRSKSQMRPENIEAACEKMLHAAGLPSLTECAILPGTRCVQDTD